MAGPCQNKGWGREKWSEKKAETDLNAALPKYGVIGCRDGKNGRRWDERKGRDGPKWPAPARRERGG